MGYRAILGKGLEHLQIWVPGLGSGGGWGPGADAPSLLSEAVCAAMRVSRAPSPPLSVTAPVCVSSSLPSQTLTIPPTACRPASPKLPSLSSIVRGAGGRQRGIGSLTIFAAPGSWIHAVPGTGPGMHHLTHPHNNPRGSSDAID